jgi:c-di-GMP-binding flagellar brake protein YcgR
MTERRNARRYDLSLPIRVSIEKEATFYRSQTRDISTAGVYFMLRSVLTAGVALDLTMTIPAEVSGGTDVLIRAIGIVARVDKDSINGNQPVGVAAAIRRYTVVRTEGVIEAAPL